MMFPGRFYGVRRTKFGYLHSDILGYQDWVLPKPFVIFTRHPKVPLTPPHCTPSSLPGSESVPGWSWGLMEGLRQ